MSYTYVKSPTPQEIEDHIRAARAAIKERSGAQSLDWAAYVHYGDPRENPLADRRREI